ncbi:MAG: sugar ABC transporter ATP-binding protein [Acidobacteria bacterium]|nr:MAG: sugar ABC transporter ATP-binding protein [Acidobacteriota bacterium]
MVQPYLSMRGITKSFPGVRALDGASLEVAAGSCHALVGENGAGKSTLMKILAGAVLPDSGEILLGGGRVEIGSPLAARRSGISMIYQELDLLPELTVAENIFLGREPRRGWLLDRRRMIAQSRAWLGRLGQAIDPRRKASDLSLAEQQMVEIAKAVSLEARVLVMDEPSAILTERELEELFRLMAALRTEGLALIYISHRLEEIFRVSDRVTVMRDGRTIATHETGAVSRGELVREMVGRELARIFPVRREPLPEVALEVRHVSRGARVRSVSLRVRRGEIVGLAGLVGAGRSELARLIFGADRADSGEVVFEGETLEGHGPHEAIRRGIGFLTEDRKGQGLLLDMTVRENITIAALAALSRVIWLSRRKERAEVLPLVDGLRIKTPGLDAPVRNLSGGNQQKAILARWLFTRSRFLIFDEPTRGVDVGAKAEIYRLITDLAGEGRGVLVISSELPEVLGLCHRIYVMRDGAIAGEFGVAEATQELLLATAMGVA